jgi:uncharacterized protein YdhG (YjbR/CyaY superfamily)
MTLKSEGPTWSWSYGSWIYNYLCNQCVHITTEVVRSNPAQARCTQYNIMWWSLSVTCNRSVPCWPLRLQSHNTSCKEVLYSYSKIVQSDCWNYWKWSTPKWSNQIAEIIGNEVLQNGPIRMPKLLEMKYSKMVQSECRNDWKWSTCTPKWSNQNAEIIGNNVLQNGPIRLLKLLEMKYYKMVQSECWNYWKWSTPKWSNQIAEIIGNEEIVSKFSQREITLILH